MQLKRDTDYALRILFCIGENRAADPKAEKGLGVPALHTQTDVPRISLKRLCDRLVEKKILLSQKTAGGESRYFPGRDLSQLSLLEVIRAVEGSAPLFAVFDKKSRFYVQNAQQIEALQAAAEEPLSQWTLGDFFTNP